MFKISQLETFREPLENLPQKYLPGILVLRNKACH